MCNFYLCRLIVISFSIIIAFIFIALSSIYFYEYNNPNPNNYDPSQDSIKAIYLDNLVYTYNGKFLNYTEHTDIINNQSIFKFNYFFIITDKTLRTLYNNDTFLCDQQSTINPLMVSGFEHLYVSGNYQKLYFYNDQCMLNYPSLPKNWSYDVAATLMLTLSCIYIFSVIVFVSVLYCSYRETGFN